MDEQCTNRRCSVETTYSSLLINLLTFKCVLSHLKKTTKPSDVSVVQKLKNENVTESTAVLTNHQLLTKMVSVFDA